MNNIFNLGRSTSRPWPSRKKQAHRSRALVFAIPFLVLVLIFAFFITSFRIPKSLFSISAFAGSVQYPQCRSETLTGSLLGQKFLWYAPHSGFSNQLSEFKNAVLMAGILNRTLVVPPVLDHHAIALGSCPKFRVLEPSEIRVSVWNHFLDLLRTGRYVSMADIVDISSLVSSSAVRVIDLRYFASLLCGVDLEILCSSELTEKSQAYEALKQCGSLLSGINGNVDRCLYAVDEDCRTTVWTYKNVDSDGMLDSFQPDERLKKKKKISYVRRRKDVYKALGHGSAADSATIMGFGSLFTAMYKEVMSAGKSFASETIKAPYLCAQLRMLDGQFKNHWKNTFANLKQTLETLSQKGPRPVHVFIMTDLSESNWTGTYLGDLSRNSADFKLYFLREQDELVKQTQEKLASAGHGQKFGSIPMSLENVKKMKNHCIPRSLSDVQLYIEEAVCSCASLGFVGTAGSTIADSVELMRKFNACSGGARRAL
ncbi:PREDICTED: uncharacterized protein LOC104806667 isoform X2 [Tarenaya hassleriana]|uniref:uncharacterized protein LOC104806667 isoform X2 n=1 Tax=Tarenaya hassleriana TaxID=28532 RepID=UPI00053C1AC8|nr:PREDICTED: uncharacterized protein LOC104806667 isoform X2 [Tarenaya hassleriana]